MGIVSGGGGGGAFNGGTITNPLTVAPTNAEALILSDSQAADAAIVAEITDGSHSLIELRRDSQLYLNRWHESGSDLMRVDSFNNTNVLEISAAGALVLHPDSGGIPLSISPRDTTKPAILIRGMTAAPPDASLNASDFTLWLDDTNGAAKLMVKAKQANGTVVAASVALA